MHVAAENEKCAIVQYLQETIAGKNGNAALLCQMERIQREREDGRAERVKLRDVDCQQTYLTLHNY